MKGGGACIYCNNCLPLRVLNIWRLNKYVVLEVNFNGKSVLLSSLNRSPSQSTDEFHNFLSKFEDNLFSIISKKPFLTCFLGNFNVKSSRWCVDEKSLPKALQIESLIMA